MYLDVVSGCIARLRSDVLLNELDFETKVVCNNHKLRVHKWASMNKGGRGTMQ